MKSSKQVSPPTNQPQGKKVPRSEPVRVPVKKMDAKPAAPKVSRTQVERRADAEERLIASALQIVAERGLSRTTLSDVGERAGFSRGLPAHHFGNKEGLLTGMIGHVRDRFLNQAHGHLDGDTGLDAVLKFVEAYLADQRSVVMRAWLVIQSEALLLDAPMHDQIASFNTVAIKTLQRMLERGIHDGSIRSDIEPRRYAMILIGILRGAAAQSLIEGRRTSPEKVLKDMEDIVRRALSTAS